MRQNKEVFKDLMSFWSGSQWVQYPTTTKVHHCSHGEDKIISTAHISSLPMTEACNSRGPPWRCRYRLVAWWAGGRSHRRRTFLARRPSDTQTSWRCSSDCCCWSDPRLICNDPRQLLPEESNGNFGHLLFHINKLYRSGTVNSNTVNSKFHLIRSFFEIFARFLSFHV